MGFSPAARGAPSASPPPGDRGPEDRTMVAEVQAVPTSDVASSPVALYTFSPALARLSARLPVNADRPALVHALIAALPDLLDGQRAVAAVAPPATHADLARFHSRPYLSLLAGGWKAADPATLAAAGLEDDCPPFDGLWEYVAHLAGGTLAAARALARGSFRVAFALDGGRHHAHPDKAAGFCYVNDAVLAILEVQRLLQADDDVRSGPSAKARVLYIDVDAHHGDGVEAAFAPDPSVLTVSIHHAAPGFFPGSGQFAGASAGGFALNLPLAAGARDGTFLRAFDALAGGAFATFRPAAVVLQLGADGLARDPVADAWSLSPAVYGRVTEVAAGWAAPLLVLGGGGYSSTETAKAWACGVCGAVGAPIPTDVPDHAHIDAYGPTWRLGESATAPTRRDENDWQAVEDGVRACLEGLAAGVEREWPELVVGGGGGRVE